MTNAPQFGIGQTVPAATMLSCSSRLRGIMTFPPFLLADVQVWIRQSKLDGDHFLQRGFVPDDKRGAVQFQQTVLLELTQRASHGLP